MFRMVTFFSLVKTLTGLQVYTANGIQKKKEAVTKHQQKVSMGFIHFVLRHFFRSPAIRVLIFMKNAPIKPPTRPKIIAAGNRNRALTYAVSYKLPNFKAEPDQLPVKFPAITFSQKAKKKVVSEHDMKTFQIIEKRQNVFGRDIS